jgi:hypothetical protein
VLPKVPVFIRVSTESLIGLVTCVAKKYPSYSSSTYSSSRKLDITYTSRGVPPDVKAIHTVQKTVLTATWGLHGVQKIKACYVLNSRLFLLYLGWLMGLEPTTTGITILTFLYSSVLIGIVQSIQINSLQ